ncbi:hypothetical protein [Algoriphagus chordae]|uniref:hypothetical protein n=1 Tax=Algoriphagus chordae TaxID=237019 RepID=UPI001314CA42|nr:hypothetical protein [Algoriphagus chordae]
MKLEEIEENITNEKDSSTAFFALKKLLIVHVVLSIMGKVILGVVALLIGLFIFSSLN